jgi:predicted lipoprotein
MRARSPLYAWMAVAMLAFTAVVALSGWVADRIPTVEELHEAAAELTPAIVIAHITAATVLHWLRRLATSPAAAAAPLAAQPTSVSLG